MLRSLGRGCGIIIILIIIFFISARGHIQYRVDYKIYVTSELTLLERRRKKSIIGMIIMILLIIIITVILY